MNWNPNEEDLEPTKIYKDHHDHDHYNCNTVTYIQSIYIIAAVLWAFMIYILDLWKSDYIVFFILLLPLIVYIINFLSLGDFTCSMEDQMFKGNFLSFGFIVAVVLINWNSPLGHNNKTEFFKILITAFILLMITLVDIWVNKEKMSIVKHIKTSIHTASLTLLALALYLYYTYHRDQYSYPNNLISTF